MSDVRHVAVVGAGIAGLTVALAFARRGAKVRAYEQATALTEVGAGLQISPNGKRVLDALGLANETLDTFHPIEAIELCDGLSAKRVVRMAVDKYRPGFGAVHRADLVSMLYQAAVANGVTFQFDARPAVEDLEPFDLIIGADGLHSLVNEELNGPSRARFTGQVAWRALIPTEPPRPAVARVAMGKGKHVVSYPLRGGTLMNIVAVEERKDWVKEGWSEIGDRSKLLARFEDMDADTRALLSQVTDCHEWGLFKHPIARKWSDHEKIALIGDAAHPTLPFMAQGANLAIEDAWVLADCVERLGREKGLVAYQKVRQARVARALAAADANARNYHLRGPVVRRLAHGGLSMVGAMAPKFLLNRFDWLYGHDVTRGH